MKNLKVTLGILFAALFIIACDESEKTNSAFNDSQDTVHQQKKGLPLDNLHRSRADDSTSGNEEVKTGVPLNNIERNKDGDSIGSVQPIE